MDATKELEWLQAIPKTELHVHLEGAIPYSALWQLIQKYGGDPNVHSESSVRAQFEYRDFPHFIETWVWKNSFLREYDDFTMIAEAVARDFSEQNIRYVEAFYSPHDFAQHGLTTARITEAIRAGLDRVADVEIKLVADLIRDFGPEQASRTLSEVHEVREHGVIGVGIGGSEQRFPAEPFSEVYEAARQLGFKTSAHAGEAAGPESVWQAIRALKVDRIGHGTRAIEDPELVEFLVDSQIPVELNPMSNVCTGIVASVAEHPFAHYFTRGMMVCINTDDPKMFHNSLADEFLQLRTHHGITRNDVRTLVLNGVHASWMSSRQKQKTVASFREHPMWRS